jgi:TPR repeat protein
LKRSIEADDIKFDELPSIPGDWTVRMGTMTKLGVLLVLLDPPEVDAARQWFERAAEAGDAEAMIQLGVLRVTQVEPPDWTEAYSWFERAAEAGDARAIDAIRGFLERAAEAGDAGAIDALRGFRSK